MRRRLIRNALILLLFPPLLSAVVGWLAGPAFLHPIRRELTPDLVREADASFAFTGATREDFNVKAPDGAILRGWKVRPKNPNGSWVLLFHGVADNRVGVIGQSEFLLRAGYSILMMDARAHGASGGPIATYGWLERNDTRVIIDSLFSSEHVGAGPVLPASAAPPLAYPTQSRSKIPTLVGKSRARFGRAAIHNRTFFVLYFPYLLCFLNLLVPSFRPRRIHGRGNRPAIRGRRSAHRSRRRRSILRQHA
jgi:hypothetical protein